MLLQLAPIPELFLSKLEWPSFSREVIASIWRFIYQFHMALVQEVASVLVVLPNLLNCA